MHKILPAAALAFAIPALSSCVFALGDVASDREADGMTTRDETTPLIFRDGMLVEWGEAAWTDLTGRPLI